MIRVLHSVSNMDRAGIETMLMNYYRSIDREKIQFDFLCNKKKIGAYDEEIKKLGGNVYYSPGFNPIKIFEYIKLLKKIKEDNPDIKIIHAHNAALSAYTLYCAKKAGFDIRIVHSHSTKIPSTKKIKIFDLKWIYKKILKKFVTRNSTYNIACGTDAGIFLFKNKKFEIINNSIIVHNFKFNDSIRCKIRNKYAISNNEIVIGHIGRFNIVKNHTFIIDLFNELYKYDKKNYKLMLIGDGELKKSIINKVEKLNLVDNVFFVDSCPNANEYYNAMDIFVLPSKFEGIPVVGIEAQISGLKCIFSNKISQESKISECVKFLPIDNNNSIDNWKKEIINLKNSDRKKVDYSLFQDYNVEQSVNKLEKIYNEQIIKIKE